MKKEIENNQNQSIVQDEIDELNNQGSFYSYPEVRELGSQDPFWLGCLSETEFKNQKA